MQIENLHKILLFSRFCGSQTIGQPELSYIDMRERTKKSIISKNI